MDTTFQFCEFGKMDEHTLTNGEGGNFCYMPLVKIKIIITISVCSL